jgi:hypothetical protein
LSSVDPPQLRLTRREGVGPERGRIDDLGDHPLVPGLPRHVVHRSMPRGLHQRVRGTGLGPVPDPALDRPRRVHRLPGVRSCLPLGGATARHRGAPSVQRRHRSERVHVDHKDKFPGPRHTDKPQPTTRIDAYYRKTQTWGQDNPPSTLPRHGKSPTDSSSARTRAPTSLAAAVGRACLHFRERGIIVQCRASRGWCSWVSASSRVAGSTPSSRSRASWRTTHARVDRRDRRPHRCLADRAHGPARHGTGCRLASADHRPRTRPRRPPGRGGRRRSGRPQGPRATGPPTARGHHRRERRRRVAAWPIGSTSAQRTGEARNWRRLASSLTPCRTSCTCRGRSRSPTRDVMSDQSCSSRPYGASTVVATGRASARAGTGSPATCQPRPRA